MAYKPMKMILGILISGMLFLGTQTALAAPMFSLKDCDAFKTIAPFNRAGTARLVTHRYTDRIDCQWGYSFYDKKKGKRISNSLTVRALNYAGEHDSYIGIGFLNTLPEAFEQSRIKAEKPNVCTNPNLDCVASSKGDYATYLIREDIRGSSFSGGPQTGYEAHYGEIYRDFLITIYANEANEFSSVRYPNVPVETIAKTKSLINERLGIDPAIAAIDDQRFFSELDVSDIGIFLIFLFLLISFLTIFSTVKP